MPVTADRQVVAPVIGRSIKQIFRDAPLSLIDQPTDTRCQMNDGTERLTVFYSSSRAAPKDGL